MHGLVLTVSAECQIEKMLQVDPKERLTTDGILKHPWMTGSKAVETVVSDAVKHNLASFVDKRKKKKRRNSDSEIAVAKPSQVAAAILARRNHTSLM